MTVLLLNSILWPLVLLIAVPLFIHLFARSKPPVYNFSSIEFILRIIRSTMRIKRPQDWLLLLVRTLLFAAVIFMFLRPLFFSRRELASPFLKKNVVLIVDATASMGYADGAQTRFAAACAEASEVLSGLSSRDTANIIWLKASPEPVFPEMGVNLGFLQDTLRRARVTAEAGNTAEALRMAVRMLEGLEGKREICVLSDFQKTTWDAQTPNLPPSIGMVKVKVGAEEAANSAVTDIRFDPPDPLIGEDVTIYCDAYNYSPQPKRTTVYLGIEESRLSQDVMIPPWNKATAAFKHKFTVPGMHPVKASVTEDAFASDDKRWAVIDVREYLRVGMFAQDDATAWAWRNALDALGWAKTEAVFASDLIRGETPFDILMLSGWNGAGAENLRKRVAEGCTVVCFPARSSRIGDVAAIAAPKAQQSADVFRWEYSENAAHRLKIANEKDSIFKLFAAGEHGDLARAAFRGRLNFPASALPGFEPLLTFDDDVPALLRFTGTGRLFVWNMPLGNESSTFAKQSEYVPFLGELLLASRSARNRANTDLCFLPGEPVILRLDQEVPSSEIALKHDNGDPVPIRELRENRGMGMAATGTLDPGIYSWEHQGKLLSYACVNFPTPESDLRAMTLRDIEKPGSVSVAGGSKVRQMRDGLQLWPYLLMSAIALALVEGTLLLWVERK
jgi:hypothetical protein